MKKTKRMKKTRKPKASQQRSEVEQIALCWWMAQAPLVMSEEEHLANPTINCTTWQQMALAEAVAHMARRWKR